MIIYALVIIAALFFLSWNLIENRKLHFITSLVTTVLFLIAVFFAVANFGYHYGMHLVNESPRTRSIKSTASQGPLKMIVYRPMGVNRDSQLIIYRNHQHRVVHTNPDSKVTNRIVRSNQIKYPHLVTTANEWKYRNSAGRFWFELAKKPSTDRVKNVFYVPRSWHVLSVRQTMALKQIIKNRSRQLKQKMDTPQAKQQMAQRATAYVKVQLTKAVAKDPKMSAVHKERLTKQAANEFKAKAKQSSEEKLISEALQTTKTIK